MADLNTVYAGTVDQQDPDIVIGHLPPTWFWQTPDNLYLPDAVRDRIRKSNADSTATIEAVKVPYTGTTQADRTAWLQQRLQAINDRAAFIKARTDELLTAIKNLSGDATYQTLVKGISAGLALIPGFGSIVSFASNQASLGQTIEAYKLQTLVQSYTADLQQLAQIRTQLFAEYQAAPAATTTGTDTSDTTSNAPTVTVWWYLAAGIALLLIFLYLKNRRNRRKRR